MRSSVLLLTALLWTCLSAQHPIALKYDFKKLEMKPLHYAVRTVMEVENIRGEQSRKQKTTLATLQERTFQAQNEDGLISIRFQEIQFSHDYDQRTPENTVQIQSLSWKSSQPEFVSSSEWGNKSLKEIPVAFQKQLKVLPKFLSQPLTLKSSASGALVKLDWPQIPKEHLQNMKNSWILLPPNPIELGGHWSHSFQENLGELGTLKMTVDYLFKEWLESSQIARVEGYFHFSFDDTSGRSRHEAQTSVSEESGKIVFEWDCAQGVITQMTRTYQFTLIVTVPTEAGESMTLKTKIYHQTNEAIE